MSQSEFTNLEQVPRSILLTLLGKHCLSLVQMLLFVGCGVGAVHVRTTGHSALELHEIELSFSHTPHSTGVGEGVCNVA